MLSYSQTEPTEWTNNAVESYHRRLQLRLTKNPTIQQFVTELQREEKYYSDKYFELFKYGNLNTNGHETKKRKAEKISKEPLQSTITDLSHSIIITPPPEKRIFQLQAPYILNLLQTQKSISFFLLTPLINTRKYGGSSGRIVVAG